MPYWPCTCHQSVLGHKGTTAIGNVSLFVGMHLSCSETKKKAWTRMFGTGPSYTPKICCAPRCHQDMNRPADASCLDCGCSCFSPCNSKAPCDQKLSCWSRHREKVATGPPIQFCSSHGSSVQQTHPIFFCGNARQTVPLRAIAWSCGSAVAPP